jgi:hypothetical protein
MRLGAKIFLIAYTFCLSWYTWLDLGHELSHHIHNPIHYHEHTHDHHIHDHDSIKRIHDNSQHHDETMETTFFVCFLFFEDVLPMLFFNIISEVHHNQVVLNFPSIKPPPITPPIAGYRWILDFQPWPSRDERRATMFTLTGWTRMPLILIFLTH